MRLSADETWKWLRRLDDPTGVERPARFDEAATSRRFRDLVSRLDASFGCRCATDAGFPSVQDASFFGDVRVPAAATRSGADIAIRVSNFGGLAVYDLEGLLCYDEDERLVLLDSDDRELIEAALEASGHVVIADDDLHQPYDGANKALRARVDWWTRFFDYF